MARAATSRKVGKRENFFGFLTKKRETYRRDVAGERADRQRALKYKADQEKARHKEMADTQRDIQEGYAYDTGARHKKEGKKPHPEQAVLVVPQKYFGVAGTRAMARREYMKGYRENPAVSPAQYRLAQAVLSGSARETGMSRKVAQEIVDRTPAKKRSAFMKRNLFGFGRKKRKSGEQIQAERERKEELARHARDERERKEHERRHHLEFVAKQGRYPTAFEARALKNKAAARTKARTGKKKTRPIKKTGKGNPAEDAAALYRKFHGRAPSKITRIVEPMHVHRHLAELGDLVRLVIDTPTGLVSVLNFNTSDPRKIVKLASSEKDPKTGEIVGKQLYLRGGDQEVNLKGLKMDSDLWIRDRMELGRLHHFKRGDPPLVIDGEKVKGSITYRTRKEADKNELIDYWHKAGEETEKNMGEAARPLVLYDYRNKKIEFAGGQYHILEPGIIN